MAKLKNYTSEQPVENIIAKLQKTLGEHGAKRISFEYGDAGQLTGITFAIAVTPERLIDIKLPAQIDKVKEYLKRQWESGEISHKRGKDKTYGDQQVTRVAWANVLAWTEAQMTYIALGQVKFEQAFLPYMVTKTGKTIFETLEANRWEMPLLVSGPKAEEGTVIEG